MNSAVEIPPETPTHRCAVRKEALWHEGDTLYRPTGTLWQCPECFVWWKTRWFTSAGGTIEWGRVDEGTKDWKRIEAHLKTSEFTETTPGCTHENTHTVKAFLGMYRRVVCDDCGQELR